MVVESGAGEILLFYSTVLFSCSIPLFHFPAPPFFYPVRVFKLDHGDWCEQPRIRLYVVGISQHIGGEKAAAFVEQLVDGVVNLRRLASPVRLWPDIVDPNSAEETQRRKTSQAGLPQDRRFDKNHPGKFPPPPENVK